MAEEKNVAAEENVIVLKEAAARDEDYVIKLKKPYLFEGQEYAEIDLNGIKEMTIRDGIDAQKALFNGEEIAAVVMAEVSTSFARMLAAKATGLPIEFFELARIGELTSLNESQAENRMAEEGFAAANVQQNFVYACVIASMATGLPEEFFFGLPLREIMKLKGAVNDSSFFE